MTDAELYPLSFKPIFKSRVWGGTRLAALGKTLPAGQRIGESWELVDLPEDQSVVEQGSLAGCTLEQLVGQLGERLLGPVALDGGRFPLLVKYIDASQTLSMQVHPDAAAAPGLGGRPKSEAWYIMDAGPDAALYLGLQPGTTARAFSVALEVGEVERLVSRMAVRPGDLFPVPPGTVHAIGAGVLLAEVQQPSDTTYRVYDWGRMGLDGQPRELHVEQAMQSIHFDARPGGPVRKGRVEMGLFSIDLLEDPDAAHDGEGPAVLVGLEGRLQVQGVACGPGDTLLVPHAIRGARIETEQHTRALWVTFR